MTWVFGYGSLVWRPAFSYVEVRDGWVADWARRFWQGSTDHRGVPGAPGRVATLVPQPEATCWGRAFAVAPEVADEILSALDHREKGGYERRDLEVYTGAGPVTALVYLATPDNDNWLGPAPLTDIARQVVASRGPSGHNTEYVLRLADAIAQMGGDDPHLSELATLVRASM